jgi:hypothetical protein
LWLEQEAMANLVPLFSTTVLLMPCQKDSHKHPLRRVAAPTEYGRVVLHHTRACINGNSRFIDIKMDSTRAYPSTRARYTFRKLLHNRASLPANNFRDRDAPQNMEHQTEHDNRKRENVKPQLPAHLTCNSMPIYSRVHRSISLAQFVYASLLTSAASMP